MQEDDGKHQDQLKELTEKTTDSLDDLALKMLFISVQGNNLELCISFAIKQWAVYINFSVLQLTSILVHLEALDQWFVLS